MEEEVEEDEEVQEEVEEEEEEDDRFLPRLASLELVGEVLIDAALTKPQNNKLEHIKQEKQKKKNKTQCD